MASQFSPSPTHWQQGDSVLSAPSALRSNTFVLRRSKRYVFKVCG